MKFSNQKFAESLRCCKMKKQMPKQFSTSCLLFYPKVSIFVSHKSLTFSIFRSYLADLFEAGKLDCVVTMAQAGLVDQLCTLIADKKDPVVTVCTIVPTPPPRSNCLVSCIVCLSIYDVDCGSHSGDGDGVRCGG